MKDLVNFAISTKQEGANVLFVMRHKVRDCEVRFTIPPVIRAERVPGLVTQIVKAWVSKYMKSSRRTLSGKQKTLYDWIVAFHRTEGRAPTYDETCGAMGWASKGTAHGYSSRLVERGWLWRDEEGHMIPIDIMLPDSLE